MTDNPHQQSIILHGGPYDGALKEISASIVGYGRLIVSIEEEDTYLGYLGNSTTRMRRGTYERRHMAEGRYGTCECRDWYEWHWLGEDK